MHERATDSPYVDDDGFTLIELLIVIVVLGILAGVVVFSLGGVTTSAAVAACQANVKTVETAVSAYNAQTGGSPVATPALLTASSGGYLSSWPSGSGYTITLSGGTVYVQTPSDASPILASSASSCSGAGTGNATTSTTVAPTTTTSTPSNGVTATTSRSGSSMTYYGTETVAISNATNAQVSLTITVQNTGGFSSSQSSFDTFGGFSDSWHVGPSNTIVYTFSGTVSAYASSGDLVAQLYLGSTPHPTSGDTWSLTTTKGGITNTQSGTFA